MDINNLGKRIILTIAGIVAILLIAFFVSTKNESEEAVISNGDDTFASIGSEKITNEEMFDYMIKNYGLNIMINDLDKNLLSSYIEQAKNDPDFDADLEFEKAHYSGLTLEEAKKYYTDEQIKELALSFKETLILNNYTEESYKNVLYLNHAKELYALDELKNRYENDAYYKVDDIKDYYEKNYYDQATAIVVSFASEDKAIEALKENGIEFTDEANYSNLEVLKAIVNIYNSQNSVDKQISVDDNGNISDDTGLVYDFDDLANSNANLAKLIFRTLNKTSNPYSTEPLEVKSTYSTKYYLAYKLAGDEQNDFFKTFFLAEKTESDKESIENGNAAEFTAEKNADLFTELVNLKITDDAPTKTSDFVKDYRYENNFKIYNYILGYHYINSNDDFELSKPNGNILYSYDVNGTTVNVDSDEFYNILLENVGALTFEKLSDYKLVMSDDDLVATTITDEVKNNIESNIQNYKTAFNQGYYASYGFDPDSMSYAEFLLLGLGSTSEVDFYNTSIEGLVYNAYIDQELRQPKLDYFYQLMEDTYNEGFSVDTTHILAYIDMNGDNTPDKTTSDTWTDLQTSLAKELLETTLIKFIDEDNFSTDEMEALVDKYNNSSTDDVTYGKFREAGIILKVENFTATESGLEQPFADACKNVYDNLIESGKNSGFYDSVVETSYGYHIIYCQDPELKDDAYPDDDTKVFPTEADIEQYYKDDSGMDDDLVSFIETYYKDPVDDYLDDHTNTFLDETKDKMGINISSKHVEDMYNEMVAVNKAALSRSNS